MLLAFDIGNTNIHLGLWNGDRWALSWRARTVHDKMPDEYGVLVRNFLNSADVGFGAISGAVIGSVVPPLTLAFTELVQRYFKMEPLVVNSKVKLGMKVAVDQPEQAGADRLENAAAVVALHGGGPTIVIDFGTSTNFDIVSSKGEYCGGAICAGIGVSHDALVSRAAKLHKIDLVAPPKPIGTNTIHAMQSGIFYGHIAMIEGLVARIKAQLVEEDPTHPNVRVIATGGLATLIQKHTTVIDQIEPELTLNGLRVIYDLNADSSPSR